MEDFLHINLGNVLTILSFFVGGMGFVWALKGDVKLHGAQLGMIVDRFEVVERKVDKLGEVIVTLARQEERLTAMDQRMLMQGQRLDDAYKRMTDLERRSP